MPTTKTIEVMGEEMLLAVLDDGQVILGLSKEHAATLVAQSDDNAFKGNDLLWPIYEALKEER